jgi:hypothetical protein
MNRVRLSHPNGARPADRLDRVAATSSLDDLRDPWLEMIAAGVITSPLAGEPGHGCTAVLRRQRVLLVDRRVERGYTGAFELICGECGDNLYLDYSQLSPRLQQIRGPYTLAAGLAAYEQHIGLTASDSSA